MNSTHDMIEAIASDLGIEDYNYDRDYDNVYDIAHKICAKLFKIGSIHKCVRDWDYFEYGKMLEKGKYYTIEKIVAPYNDVYFTHKKKCYLKTPYILGYFYFETQHKRRKRIISEILNEENII